MISGTLAHAPRHPRRWMAGLLLATTIVVLGPQIDLPRAFDRLLVAGIEALRATTRTSAPHAIPPYRVEIEARPVAGVTDNLSGLAYDPVRQQLWAVVNDPPELLALDPQGRLLARHALDGFADVEGVAWLGADLLMLVEERRQALVLVPTPAAGEPIQRKGLQALRLVLAGQDNAGFEGLSYDRSGDRLFVVKEHTPRKLYEIRGIRAALEGRLDVEIIDREAWIGSHFLARDFSSVEFDPDSGHLLLLSDDSRLIVELDGEGRFLGYHPLAAGFAGLQATIPQAEGLTLGPDRSLYLVSEPNLFYAFRGE